MVSPQNRPSVHTTTHLENSPGWLLIFRTPRSALYLRKNARNRENLQRVAAYYASRGVPFSPDRGLDLEGVMREAPEWAAAHGVLPTHLAGLEAASRSLDPLRGRAAREQLGALYASLGLYERAIAIERVRLRAEPDARAAGQRLVWALLHAGRFSEAREVLERQLAAGGAGDGGLIRLLELARSPAPSGAVAARVATLPLLEAGRARRVLAGFREPEPRSARR